MDASNATSQATPKKQFAIGIDLGTSFSASAVYQANNKNRNAEVVYDKEGHASIPSIVAFTPKKKLVGYKARDQIDANPEYTISEVKRLLGHKFNDPEVQNAIIRWPFTIVNVDDEPKVQVKFLNEIRQLRPEQIAAALLIYLKQRTCDFVKVPAFSEINAVLTVPVNFGEGQRLAIQEACQIAKINCLRIITEPSAIALAYAWQNVLKKVVKDRGRRILVFDMGGGTTDVSIVQMGAKQQYNVLATVGEHIGGEDFDTLLTNYCLKNNNLSPTENDIIKNDKKKITRLRMYCEHVKRILSEKVEITWEMDEIFPDRKFVCTFTRKKFEELIRDKVEKSVVLMTQCIASAKTLPSKIEKVILAGGSSRIPYVQQMIRENLPAHVPLSTELCKDEVVACGAALQAAHDANFIDLRIIEIIPWTLGIELEDGGFSRIIAKNSPIPISITRCNYQTACDNQTAILIPIYEGENDIAKENKYLGQMTLKNIRIAPKGEVKDDITFEVDKYGILQATAVEQGTNNTISVTIDRYKKQLTAEAVEGLAEDTEQENLLDVIHELQEQLEALDVKVASEHRLKVIAQKNKVKKWQQQNQNINVTITNVKQLINDLQTGLQGTGIVVSNHGVIHYPK